MKSIYDLNIEEMELFFINNNEKKYRASQVFDWLYNKRVNSFKLMANLGDKIVNLLESNFIIDNLKIVKKEIDSDVVKYLFELNDGSLVEAVLMKHDMEIVYVFQVKLVVIWDVYFVKVES